MKYVIAIIVIPAAILSTILTLSFMVQIGTPTGLTAVFVGVGLVMEGAKIASPVLAMKAHHRGDKAQCLALGVLTALLVSVSFTASIVSVQAGSEGVKLQSIEYIGMSKRIEALQLQAANNQKSIDALPANYFKVRSTKEGELSALNGKIDTLIQQQSELKPNSIIVQYGSEIAVITATIIELITFLFIPLLSPTETIRNTATEANDVGDTLFTVSDTKPVPVRVADDSSVISVTVSVSLEDAIKQAVIDRKAKPSQRGIRRLFSGISNNRITELLRELEGEGVLIDTGNGWTYA